MVVVGTSPDTGRPKLELSGRPAMALPQITLLILPLWQAERRLQFDISDAGLDDKLLTTESISGRCTHRTSPGQFNTRGPMVSTRSPLTDGGMTPLTASR